MDTRHVNTQLLEMAFRIREMRNICGFTEEEMARRTDTTVAEYRVYEAGGADHHSNCAPQRTPLRLQQALCSHAAVTGGVYQSPWGRSDLQLGRDGTMRRPAAGLPPAPGSLGAHGDFLREALLGWGLFGRDLSGLSLLGRFPLEKNAACHFGAFRKTSLIR